MVPIEVDIYGSLILFVLFVYGIYKVAQTKEYPEKNKEKTEEDEITCAGFSQQCHRDDKPDVGD
jgi:hypothetical protein